MRYVLILVLLVGLAAPALAYTLDAYQGINEVNCPSVNWQQSHAYNLRDVLVDSNGNYELATTAGSSAGSQPSWSTTIGSTQTDGGVTWMMYKWAFEKVGHRWLMCDPLKHGFFLVGVVGVNYSNGPASLAQIQAKYGSASNTDVVGCPGSCPAGLWAFNWTEAQVNRLKAWNFTYFADGSSTAVNPPNISSDWNTSDHTLPAAYRMPFDTGVNVTRYAMLPSGPPGCSTTYPLKDLVAPVTAQVPYAYNLGDYFDPHFPACANALWNSVGTPYASGLHEDYLNYTLMDEGDQLGGLLGTGYYPAFNTVNINNGTPGGNAPAYHASWVTLITAPTQASGTPLGTPETYTDEEVYGKVTFANDLVNEYLCTAASTPLACCTGNKTGTCSVDPAAGAGVAVTGANMTTAKNALNTAWSSTYTTLGTSDAAHCGAGLATCLQGGTYAAWGTGTGLLDENGGGGWLGNNTTLVGETASMQADMNAFLGHYARQYLDTVTIAVHTYLPGILTTMSTGGYGNPARLPVLQAEGQYLDFTEQDEVPPYCPTCTDIQLRTDAVAAGVGDRPWKQWQGWYANPDSAESANVLADNIAATQPLRGAAYQALVNQQLAITTTTYGSHPIIGWYWWGMYDSNAEGRNWGLLTPTDNAYDGQESVVGTVACTISPQYSCGGEVGAAAPYGNFVTSVTAANQSIFTTLANEGAGVGGSNGVHGGSFW